MSYASERPSRSIDRLLMWVLNLRPLRSVTMTSPDSSITSLTSLHRAESVRRSRCTAIPASLT